MTTQSALTATVNHFMKELGLSETDVAARCGISISTVRRITQGTGKYSSPMTALKLMQDIGVAPERFYAVLEGYRAELPMSKLLD